MKKLTLIAILFSTPAYADDTAQTAGAGTAAPVATAQPAAQPPSLWMITDLEASDINTLQQCSAELPKKIADPFIDRIRARLKVVK